MDFNSQAANWDDERRIARARVIAEQIAHAASIKESYCALEFGCGTGLISFYLYDKLKEITCIDTSKGMIDTLQAKIKKNKVTNIAAYQLDINKQHSLTAKYDVIYTSMALHHIVDIEKILKSLYSLLKKGGTLCIVELDEEDGSFHKLEKDFHGHNGFNQHKLKKVLEHIGFEEVNSRTFYKDKKIIEKVSVEYSLFIMKGEK